MDLDVRQTRRLFLAGAVAFPKPFPSTGTISLATSQLAYAVGQPTRPKEIVLSQEQRRNRTVVRLMLQEDVSAIFIPGAMDSGVGTFQISNASRVDDFEKGEWFVDDDVNEAAIRARLGLDRAADISSRNSILRGIVFIPEERRILRIIEMAQTAGADDDWRTGQCTCEWGPCTCCW